jgi:hypothetical protein
MSTLIMKDTYRVTFSEPHAPGRVKTRRFMTRDEALAFFADANLACLFLGTVKLAESIKSEQ